jgi:hypothetical protein
MSRLHLVAAVLVVTLTGAGLGIAAALGAFNSGVSPFNEIGAAQHVQAGANVLSAAAEEQIKQWNAQNARAAASRPGVDEVQRLLPDTARVIGKMPNGSPIFVLTDTHGETCLGGGLSGGCGSPLNRSDPLIIGAVDAPTIGHTYYAGGLVLDGVTSVSFRAWGKDVTVPVKHNVYIDEKPHSTATLVDCITAHFADGSTYHAPVRGRDCGNS